jgi:hypothetical protein
MGKPKSLDKQKSPDKRFLVETRDIADFMDDQQKLIDFVGFLSASE